MHAIPQNHAKREARQAKPFASCHTLSCHQNNRLTAAFSEIFCSSWLGENCQSLISG
jgi:hypothetical protein